MTTPRWADDEHRHLSVTIEADAIMTALAREVIDLQDAANLCGLSQRFAEVMIELNRSPQNNVGTTWANQHPVVRLWVDKFAHLSGYAQDANSTPPYAACFDLAKGKTVEWQLRVSGTERLIWEETLRGG
jgi:hypothetical protein